MYVDILATPFASIMLSVSLTDMNLAAARHNTGHGQVPSGQRYASPTPPGNDTGNSSPKNPVMNSATPASAEMDLILGENLVESVLGGNNSNASANTNQGSPANKLAELGKAMAGLRVV